MEPLPLFDWIGPLIAASILVPIVITGALIGLIVWAIRRSVPRREDPAVAALKARYARGEIDPAEFEVRMGALMQDRD